jgi:glucose-6-phosphate isomerase
MTARHQSLTERPARKALEKHSSQIRDVHLRQLFADDLQRGGRMTAEANSLIRRYRKLKETKR